MSCEGAPNVTRIAEEISLSSAAGFSLDISYLVPSLKLREMRRKKKSRRSSIQREQKAISVEKECEFRFAQRLNWD